MATPRSLRKMADSPCNSKVFPSSKAFTKYTSSEWPHPDHCVRWLIHLAIRKFSHPQKLSHPCYSPTTRLLCPPFQRPEPYPTAFVVVATYTLPTAAWRGGVLRFLWRIKREKTVALKFADLRFCSKSTIQRCEVAAVVANWFPSVSTCRALFDIAYWCTMAATLLHKDTDMLLLLL